MSPPGFVILCRSYATMSRTFTVRFANTRSANRSRKPLAEPTKSGGFNKSLCAFDGALMNIASDDGSCSQSYGRGGENARAAADVGHVWHLRCFSSASMHSWVLSCRPLPKALVVSMVEANAPWRWMFFNPGWSDIEALTDQDWVAFHRGRLTGVERELLHECLASVAARFE